MKATVDNVGSAPTYERCVSLRGELTFEVLTRYNLGMATHIAVRGGVGSCATSMPWGTSSPGSSRM